MRFTSLIAITAIIMMIAAVGCSNNSSTTSPMENSAQSLQLNGSGSNAARFDNTPNTPDNPPTTQDVDVITGIFNYDSKYHCSSLMVAKDTYVELVSETNNPNRLKNGTLVRAYGTYNLVPGYNCQLSLSFTYRELVIVRTNSTGEPNSGISN